MAFRSARATGAASITTRALFLSGTALGVSILIAAAVPGQAWAGDECGNDINGVALCTATTGVGNPYPGGIVYVGDAGEDITVILAGGGPLIAVDVVTNTGNGVNVDADPGNDATVTAFLGAQIDSTFNGIDVDAVGGGDAEVDSAATITAGYSGISVYAGAGDAIVQNSGNIYAGGNVIYSTGISVDAVGFGNIAYVNNTGDITVDTNAFFAAGIDGYSFAGVVEVYNDADLSVSNSFGSAYGISVGGQNLGVTIDTTGGIYVYADGNAMGVDAYTLVDADVSVTGYIEVHSNGDTTGVSVYAAGAATVNITGDIYADVDDYNFDNTGIYVYGYTGLDLTVTGDILVGDGDVATGIDAIGYNGVTATITGDVQVGDGIGTLDTYTGVGISAYSQNGAVDITMTGDLSVYSYNDATGAYIEAATGATLDITGNVNVYSYIDSGMGVLMLTGGTSSVTVDGDVDVYGFDDATGVVANGATGGDVTVTGNVDVFAANGTGVGVDAYGLFGGATITVGDGISVYGYDDATGALAQSFFFDATIDVTGYTHVYADTLSGMGLQAQSLYGAASVTTDGDVYVFGETTATGISAAGFDSATVDATGDIDVTAWLDDGIGVEAFSSNGIATATVTGDVDVYGYLDATGVQSAGLDGATSEVTGNVTVDAQNDTGYGVTSYSFFGDAESTVTGDVLVTADGRGAGIAALSVFGDATATAIGDVTVTSFTADAGGVLGLSTFGDAYAYATGNVTVDAVTQAVGVTAIGYGDATVGVTGDIDVDSSTLEAYGIVASADLGDSSVISDGSIIVDAEGFAEGVVSHANLGDASADVSGSVFVTANANDAVGIDVVSNGGDTSVTGTVDIYADSDDFRGWGVYATSHAGSVYVNITGDIAAYGNTNAYAVDASGVTDVTVDVTGNIDAGATNYAVGVSAISSTGDTAVTVVGDLDVGATIDSTAIYAYATLGDASIDVTGNTSSFAFAGIGYGLVAIASQGDASVTVTGGDLYTYGDDVAIGIIASGLTSATVDVTGGIEVYAYAGPGTGVRTATAGASSVDITGYVEVDAFGNADGVYAFGVAGSDVTITGNLAVDSFTGQGLGIFSQTVNNTASATLVGDAYIYGETAGVGLTAISSNGDSYVGATGDLHVTGYNSVGQGLISSANLTATIYLNGSLDVYGRTDALGMTANGYSAVVTVIGDVDVYSYFDDGLGINLSATTSATLDMTGDLYTYGFDYGTGVQIKAETADVTFVGDIDVIAQNLDGYGTKINTTGDASVSFTGAMTVEADDLGYGLSAISANGALDITVDGSIDVSANNNYATGVNLYADQDIDLSATGSITSESGGDSAWGVFATSFHGYTDLTVEDVTVTSSFGGAGVETYGYLGASAISTGAIHTYGDYIEGISATSTFGDVYVSVNDVTTDGFSSEGGIGVSFFGDVNVNGVGAVTTTGDYASGLSAISRYGDATGDNSGVINTAGIYSYGVSAYSYAGDATAINTGAVYTTGDYSDGLRAYAYNGIATVDNADGHVETSGDYAYGIYAYGFSGVNISNGANTVITSGYSAVGIFGFSANAYVLINSGHVETSGNLSAGIVGISLGGDATDYVTINSDLVNTTGNDSDGIDAYTYYGDITIDSGTVHTSGDSSYGIDAYAFNYGDVDITSDLVTTNGLGSVGIYGYAFLGTTTVDSGTVMTFDDLSTGIYAYGFTGADVTADQTHTYGDFSTGIFAIANLGKATVDSFNVTTDGYASAGIVAIGHYGVEIDSVFVSTFGDRSDGVVGLNYGGGLVDVYSHSSYTQGDYADGIVAVSFGYYDSFAGATFVGDTYVDSDFVRTEGYNAYGIIAEAGGGDVEVHSYFVRTYGDSSTGIYAAAFNYYDPTPGFEGNFQGDVSVFSSRVYTSGANSTGIDTYAEGGNISITSNQVVTRGDGSDGIDAYAAYYLDPVLLTYYSGDVSISATSTTTYGDGSDGINAYAGGGDVLVLASLVRAYGLGADAIYAGTGGLDASNTDDVEIHTYNRIYSYDAVGIHVNSAGASDINVESGSVYGFDWAIQSNSVDGTYIYNDGAIYGGGGRAIDVNGAAAFIQNDGAIYGFVNLTDNADHLEQDGDWYAYGTSSFGLGSDDVDNDGYMTFSQFTGAAATTTLSGLEFFDNAGTISGVDGQVNDQLVMTATSFTGLNGVGQHSELDLDVQLGGPGSAADRLFIGSAQGSTLIVPNDVLAGSPGALNFGGILVVDSANAAEVGNEFSMANVDKGFVEYSLFFDAANDNWLIVGLPDQEAFELLGAMSGGQDFWRRSGDAISARWQEARDAGGYGGASAGPGGAGRSDGWELWMQAAVGGEKIDNLETYTIGGFSFAPDLSEKSDNRGFQFGFDNLQGTTLYGATMGFNQQEMKFNVDGNSFDTEGWNVGAYAGWASDGFFLNGLIKGDFYTVDGNFHTIPTLFSFDGTTWGAQGEVGYRWGGDDFFIEPIAALSWTTTSLDSVTTSGMTVDFDDATSLRGKAGARVGGTMGSGDVIVTPYIGAYWVDEFEGDNALTFTTGATSIDFADTGLGSHGLVDFGFTAQTLYGLEGFVKGEWNFGGDIDGGTARIGVRWRW